jgi:hypothetical protein
MTEDTSKHPSVINYWITTWFSKFRIPMAWWKELDPQDRPEIQDFGDDWIRIIMGDDLGIIGELVEIAGEIWLRVTSLTVAGENTAHIFDNWLMPALERSKGQLYAYISWDEGDWRSGLALNKLMPDERIERLQVVNGKVTVTIKRRIAGRNRRWEQHNRLLDRVIAGRQPKRKGGL